MLTARIPAINTIAGLKARIDIVDLVGRYAELKQRGHDFWARCPLHADRSPSFKVNQKYQSFYCFGCLAKGDVLDFLQAAEGLDKVQAIQRLNELAGIPAPDPAVVARREGRRAATEAKVAADAARRSTQAQEIWRAAHPLCGCHSCEPGRRYLAGRGITTWPEALFFHHACPFGMEVAPAIVAPVNCSRTGYVTGVWRIRLTLAGEKVGRFGLGPMKANASRLYAADSEELALAEGTEDTLATHQLTGMPCWAALSAGNLAELLLPARHKTVTIFTDADEVGRRHAHQLARRLREEGRSVRVLRALIGKDPNDQLQLGSVAG